VLITPPTGIPGLVASTSVAQKINFTCRASQIPASTVAAVDVPYFGRKVKVAGDRTFDDWSVTIINDEDYLVRVFMEAWSNALNTMQSNIRLAQAINGPTGALGSGYKSNALVTAYGKNGTVIGAYDFVGIFPTQVSAMGMDWENTNAVQTFDVVFAYDYWVPASNPIATGSAPVTPLGTLPQSSPPLPTAVSTQPTTTPTYTV
jgi:hypothetical protein